jgi:hypothetical protein
MIDIQGMRFGNLVVIGRGYHEKSKTTEWECLCDCGVTKVVPSGSLRKGKVKSCGCQRIVRPVKDITGERHGRLVITGFSKMAPNRTSIWFAKCDCGNEIEVRKTNLWIDADGKKNTVSCGCHKQDLQRLLHTTHGELVGRDKKSREYNCWTNMLQRCNNPKHNHYKSYGAKGVTVCEAWKSFKAFLADVGRAPEDKTFIDRIDPYGNYEPSNVRWVDMDTSNTNKR